MARKNDIELDGAVVKTGANYPSAKLIWNEG